MVRSVTLGYTGRMSVLWFTSRICQYTRLNSIGGRMIGKQMERSVSSGRSLTEVLSRNSSESTARHHLDTQSALLAPRFRLGQPSIRKLELGVPAQ